MTSPGSQRMWRHDFLQALAETANATIAAERAGIGWTTIYRHRARDQTFADAWERALACGRTGLASGRRPEHLRRREAQAFVIRPGRGRAAKLVRPRWDEWNEAKEDRFLEVLAETANLALSARTIGTDVSTIHKRRRRWPAFDAVVKSIMKITAESLNFKLIHEGSNSLSPPALPGAIDPPLVSVDQAIKIVQMNLPGLRLRGPTGRRVGRPCKWQPAPPPSTEELIASIEATLARLPPLDKEGEALS